MALSHKARKRWSLIILLVGMPLYVVAVISVLNWLDRPPLWLELLVYIGLGVAWILPFRGVFRGVGRADPEQDDPPER
jgi:predicted membrane channel-forming protein YqfA (hemolysin III family)